MTTHAHTTHWPPPHSEGITTDHSNTFHRGAFCAAHRQEAEHRHHAQQFDVLDAATARSRGKIPCHRCW